MKSKLIFALAASCMLVMSACKKEKGCTDPNATNYSNDAEEDDGSCTYATGSSAGETFAESFEDNGNVHADPGVSAANIVPANTLDAGNAPTDSWFDNVTFKGAFGTTDWTQGWTKLRGYDPIAGATTVDVSGTIATDGETMEWTADKTYILDGFCFVNSGGTLNIEAGTVIKGKPGENEDASALIVARGATINANGTASAPIVFTYEADPLDGSTSPDTRSQWGGVIVLGSASLNSNPGETAIEGIPTTETRGLYGGGDDGDSSGSLTYVSIRHGGTDIGAGNEINGLTLGGVGSGTTIEYIEVVGNKDDGVEFFGGTVNTKYMLTAYCGDDSFDYDEGFRGKGQFWVTIQDTNDTDASDRGGEHDGGTDPETASPYAQTIIFNATYIGDGDGRILTFRDNAGGEYHNSIFVDFGKGVDIEDLNDGEDSYSRFSNGDLALAGNVFWNIGAGSSASDLFKVSAPQ